MASVCILLANRSTSAWSWSRSGTAENLSGLNPTRRFMEHWACQSPACKMLLLKAQPIRDYFPTGGVLRS